MTQEIKIDLKKRTENFTICLSKRVAVNNLRPVKVVSVFDVSGSTAKLFGIGDGAPKYGPAQESAMQVAFDRALAIAAALDDDGTMEVHAFDTRAFRLPDADLDGYGGYIDKNIVRNRSIGWGGTSYAPVIRQIADAISPSLLAPPVTTAQPAPKKPSGLFGKLTSMFSGADEPEVTVQPVTTILEDVTPTFVLFKTDGDTSDSSATESLLATLVERRAPVFFCMIGVGTGSSFSHLKQWEKKFPNVSFVDMGNLNIADDELNDKIVTVRFTDWLKQFTK